jgi:hypothetical protein
MKGYKGFNKDMTCRNKQYAENTVFEEAEAEICSSGMHFCENPFAVLDYYGFVGANGALNEFAEVEALDECKTDDNEKYCTKKLKIGAKIGITGLIKAFVDFTFSKIDFKNASESNTGDQSAATNTGNWSAATNTGGRSAATNTGNWSAATNTGDQSAATNTGNWSAATNTGDQSAATNTGDQSAATNTGYRSAATNTGSWSAATNTGNQSAATNTGDQSAATNTGYRSAATNTGNWSVATNTGNWSAAAVGGNGSVAIATGYESKAKANVGSAIVVCERDDNYNLIGIKAAIIDGKNLKADTYYTLINGEFIEEK